MNILIGDTTIVLKDRLPGIKKIEIAVDEDGVAWFIQVTKNDGEQWRYKDDTHSVPMSSGSEPNCVLKAR